MSNATLTAFALAVLIPIDGLSIVVSLLVACRLMRLPDNLRERTAPRLMMWLALSDLCAHALTIMGCTLFKAEVEIPGTPRGLIPHVGFAINALFVYSYWLEVANAVACLLGSIRCGLCIRPWLLCFAPALATAVNAYVLWNCKFMHATPNPLPWCISAIIAALLSCASLAVVAYRAARSSDSVKKRQRRHAAAWIANALSTNMLYGIVGIAALWLPQHGDVFNLFGDIAICVKGTLNGCAIFYSSRYSNEAIKDVAKLKNPDSESFHIDLNGNVDIIPAP